MLMRNLCLPLLMLAALILAADRASALSFALRETKEELKLQYEVTVHDHGNGRIGVEFKLTDEGRLKPLESLTLNIPSWEKNKDGSYSYDLVVQLELKKSNDGKRRAGFEIRKDWAERAEIWLMTSSIDGKRIAMTGNYHVIPLAKYLKDGPAAGAKPDAPAKPAVAAPPATERKKD